MKRALHLLLALAGFYTLFCALLYFTQDSKIFYPKHTSDQEWTALIEELQADYVSIRADDGEVLEGMFLSDASETPRPTIIFFGGNAFNVAGVAREISFVRDHGFNILLMDYRGYGLSTGKPNANALKHDAEKIFAAAASHPHVDAERIVVWGYSLGTGIATHLAAHKPVHKVILFAPFTSIEDLARNAYFYVPVSLLLKHRMDSLALAPELLQPVLIIVGNKDTTLAIQHSEQLARAWGGDQVLLALIEDRGHSGLIEDHKVQQKILKFLQK